MTLTALLGLLEAKASDFISAAASSLNGPLSSFENDNCDMLSRISFRFALAGQGKLYKLGGHEKNSGIFTAWALRSKSDVISAPASSL